MTLKDKINEDLKSAMKSGEKLRLETIRSIRALILDFEKSGANRELTADDEIKMLSTAVKKRKESMEQFQAVGRTELAQKEEQELAILMEYMPKQMDENEVLQFITKLSSELNAVAKEDFSKLMPAAAKQLKGKADGKTIKTIVEKVLGIN